MQVQVFYQPGFQPRDPAAYQWFCGVDTNRSGTVDEHELQRALSAGGWAAFSRKTTRKLMNMFDADRSHSLGYGEFEQLVAYLRSWQAQFQAASHGTGRIGVSHMPAVLAQLGYHVPPPLATSIFQACALRRRQARAPPGRCRGWRAPPPSPLPSLLAPPPPPEHADDDDHSGTLGLDEYISLLAELHSLTAAFRAHDPAGSGAAHLQYATFMQIVYAARN